MEGIVGDISDAHVQFEFDGEQIPVKRGKVVGVIYYRPRTEELPPARCVVHLVDGSRLAARETNNQSTGLMVTTSAGFARLVPWDAIDWVDFSAGKVTYLSDLEPLKVDWAPLVGLPDSAKQAKAFGMPRFDRGFYGESLRLEFHAADSSHQTSEARSFAKGIAARSRSELVYRVPPGHSAFRAWAGINPQFFEQGHVRLAVFGDGETLLQADIDGRRPPLEINVPIFGVRRLRLLVDYGENLDFGDVLHLADAQFTK